MLRPVMSNGNDDDLAFASTRASMDAPAPPAPGENAPELKAGMTLNDTYRLVALLGRGGMGEVWTAEHLRLPKKVAIKVLLPSVSASGEVVARFQREAEIGSRLAHPHIVHVTDFNTLPDGRKYIAMEFLEGSPLHDRMVQGPMPFKEVAEILEQTGRGLKVAHEAGVVHRDLKPDNIFLADEPSSDPPYRVKILDFGISKIQTADRALTRDMAVMGTPGYMAPEQAMGHTAQLGPEADQFALATIAYEMLSGEVAFDGETLAEIVLRVVQATPPPIQSVVQGVPQHAAEAIARGMAKDPKERFESVEAFVDAFVGRGAAPAAAIPATQLASEPAVPATPPPATAEPVPTIGAHEPQPASGGGKIVAAALVGALLVGGGVAAFFLMGGEDPPDPIAEEPTESHEIEDTTDPTMEAETAETGATMEAETGATMEAETETMEAETTETAMTETAMTETAMTAMTETAMTETETAMTGMRPSLMGLSPEAAELLEQAQAALASNPRQALSLAQRSFRIDRSPLAREMMGRAHCAMRDLGAANAMARALPRAGYRRLARYCENQGVTLAPR